MAMTTVNTMYGTVEGIRQEGISRFLGIPYAKAGRFQPPEAPEAWEGVRRCVSFGPSPYATRGGRPEYTYAEDCLSLNIWTGAESGGERRPVMVWIYGGAFQNGSSADPMFDGTELARRGVVLVTFNYRVGALGFMPFHGIGNLGLRDELMALRWVRDNIGAFGGDRDRVTIFGQSAGGISCRMLLTSPAARGLFHRAIIESGGGLNEADPVRPIDELEAIGREARRNLGISDEALLTMDPRELNTRLGAEAARLVPGEVGVFQPVIDDAILTDVPGVLVSRGEYADLDIICGTVSGDAWMFCRKAAAQIGRNDPLLRGVSYSPSQSFARAALKNGKQPIRTYYMERTQPPREMFQGHGGYKYGMDCPHTAEVPYVFGTLSDRHTDFDRALSRTMTALWANFAATGDPNGPDLPRWDPYTREAPVTLHISDVGVAVENICDTRIAEDFIDFTMRNPGMLESLGDLTEGGRG